MLASDYDAFCEVVVGFAELKGKQLSPAAIKLYWASMQHWNITDFRQAAETLLRSCAFMPTPKDFEDLRKAARPLAGEAWAKVLNFVRHSFRPSGNHLVDPRSEFDTTTLRAVESIGGFRAIAMSDTSSTPFLEKRFAENYDSMQDVQDVREALPRLTTNSALPKPNGPVKANGLLARFTPPGDHDGH